MLWYCGNRAAESLFGKKTNNHDFQGYQRRNYVMKGMTMARAVGGPASSSLSARSFKAPLIAAAIACCVFGRSYLTGHQGGLSLKMASSLHSSPSKLPGLGRKSSIAGSCTLELTNHATTLRTPAVQLLSPVLNHMHMCSYFRGASPAAGAAEPFAVAVDIVFANCRFVQGD